MVTAVAQKALIVMTFNKGIKAITAENPKEETVSLASETEVWKILKSDHSKNDTFYLLVKNSILSS